MGAVVNQRVRDCVEGRVWFVQNTTSGKYVHAVIVEALISKGEWEGVLEAEAEAMWKGKGSENACPDLRVDSPPKPVSYVLCQCGFRRLHYSKPCNRNKPDQCRETLTWTNRHGTV